MRIIVLLLVLLLSGCLNPTPNVPTPTGNTAAAHLFCIERVCNFEATLSPDTRQANELSIAVNPADPLNIIATGKDYTPNEAGDCVWSGVYTTMDGGKTWKNQNVPGSPWKKLGDPNAPVNQDFSKFWCATDPVLAFSPDGKTAYWSVMPYQCDRASGSKTGRGVLPQGGFNDWFWTCSAMYVLVSHDGGLTWPTWKQVAFGPRLEHDKQWIATAPNGNVLLCWDRDPDYTGTGSANEQVYPSGAHVACSVSKDQGTSWSAPTRMNNDWVGYIPAVDYDAQNVAYTVLANDKEIQVAKSQDGLAWGKPVAVGSYKNPPAGGEYGWPVLRGSDFRIVNAPHIAVDRRDPRRAKPRRRPELDRVRATHGRRSRPQGRPVLPCAERRTRRHRRRQLVGPARRSQEPPLPRVLHVQQGRLRDVGAEPSRHRRAERRTVQPPPERDGVPWRLPRPGQQQHGRPSRVGGHPQPQGRRVHGHRAAVDAPVGCPKTREPIKRRREPVITNPLARKSGRSARAGTHL
jgi:hypothetical protein